MGSPPAHSALSVKRLLAKYSIPMLDHPPYSPDLAPCDFYLFPKVKSALKRTRFESVEAVKEKVARVLKELREEDFQHCFEQWKILMERCRDRGGVYIEGDNKYEVCSENNGNFCFLKYIFIYSSTLMLSPSK